MKTRKHLIILISSIGAALLIGCSRQSDTSAEAERAGENLQKAADQAADSMDRAADNADQAMDNASRSAKQALQQTEEALADTWDDIKDSTYAERASFKASAEDLSDRVGQKLDELKTNYPNASQTAMQKLRDARENLDDQVSRLDNATAETWSEVRGQVADAWQRVQQALTDFRNESAM